VRRLLALASLSGALLLAATGCGSRTAKAPSAEERAGQTTGVSQRIFDAAKKGVSGELKVAIPCGMIIPLKKAITVFRQSNPDLKVVEDYDNAGVLVTKILERGDRPDFFVSPGITEIKRLEDAGLVDPDSKVQLGSFELCAIVRRGSGVKVEKPEDLVNCKTVALPDPKLNSVGTCGQEALEKLGLWDKIEPKTVQTDQAIKAHNLVIQGKADAGISYRACPLETNPDKMNDSQVQIVFDFPRDSYEPQKIWIAPLKTAANREAADAVIDFLRSRQGLQLLIENDLPGAAALLAQAPPAAPGSTGVADTESGEPAGESGIRVLGPETAPLHITAYYPANETHQATYKVVEGLVDRYPGQVRLETVDFESDDGFDRWIGDGYTCGALVINGKSSFTIRRDGKPVEISLKKKLDQDWSEKDLYDVLDMLLAEKPDGSRERSAR
jgi:molybdate transport system substrate-binding protein